jgi:LEA14-like dessication related protein
VTIDFAHSREMRVPRLPHARFQEVEAGRSAEDEASITFRVGVYNPNPFEVIVASIDYVVTVAGKKISEGTIAKGERVTPASTGVFDLETKISADTHGDAEVRKLIKSRVLPYVITGQMKADLFSEPFEFKGNINLPPSKL